jgi:hypothetical protein
MAVEEGEKLPGKVLVPAGFDLVGGGRKGGKGGREGGREGGRVGGQETVGY